MVVLGLQQVWSDAKVEQEDWSYYSTNIIALKHYG